MSHLEKKKLSNKSICTVFYAATLVSGLIHGLSLNCLKGNILIRFPLGSEKICSRNSLFGLKLNDFLFCYIKSGTGESVFIIQTVEYY